jgi:hypothetical protein
MFYTISQNPLCTTLSIRQESRRESSVSAVRAGQIKSAKCYRLLARLGVFGGLFDDRYVPPTPSA